jgi:hypothetical protein
MHHPALHASFSRPAGLALAALTVATALLLGCGPPQPATNPDGSPNLGRHPPPPEAYEACRDRADKAPCSAKFGDKTLDGMCHLHRNDTRLACHPTDGPGTSTLGGPGSPIGPDGPPPIPMPTR